MWLKRSLGALIPEVLATPLTPKGDEVTALKHRHAGNAQTADEHFTRKLSQVLAEAKRVTKPDGIIAVMFAHQSPKAWTALINALFEAGLTVNSTWPIDTELRNRAGAQGVSALESSITVTCRPRVPGRAVSLRTVREEIKQAVRDAVQRFWGYGLRRADLIVACYGPAVGAFGSYERVEKADGTLIGIPELLALAGRAARDAIAGEFRGDNLSTLYYVWVNLYGSSEQSWDDARRVVQIDGNADNALEVARDHGIFKLDGARCRLALLADRAGRPKLGMGSNPPLIDALHRSMLLWQGERREELVAYLAERDLFESGSFWSLAQALFEVLPRGGEDWKLVSALLSERPTLRTEGKGKAYVDPQMTMKLPPEITETP